MIPPLLRPLASAPIALLWGGLATSAIGDQLFIVVLGWLGVELLGTAAGYLAATQAAVTLATALLVGAWADRIEHRRLMIAADLVRAAALLAVVAAWLAQGRPEAAMLFAAVIVLAIGQALFRPALQAVLPALVDDAALLPASNALLDTTERIARLLGPGLIGVASALLPVVHFLTLDAATFAASAIAVLVILRLRPQAAAAPARRDSLRAGIARGFAAARRRPLLGYMLPAMALINGAWFAVLFLGVPLAIARAGVTAPGADGLAAYGLVISAYGLTNLLGTLVIGNRPLTRWPGRMIFAGNTALAAGLALFGLATLLPPERMLPAMMLAATVSAVSGPMHDITMATLRQTWLPAEDIPAVIRAYMVTAQAGGLVAMALAPTLFDHLGIAATILLCATLQAATALTGLARFWSTRP